MTGQSSTLVVLAALAVLAFVAAWFWHRVRTARRRRMLGAWLAGGVEVFGGAASTRWVSAGTLQARVDAAAPPFRTLSLTARLDPAGLARLPIPGRLGRRLRARDRLVVQSDLTRVPCAEFDFFYAGGPTGRAAAAEARAVRARVSEVGEPGRGGRGPLVLAEASGAAVAPREGLLGIARRIDELSAEVRRVAVRRQPPHLLAEVEAPGATGEVTAQAFFDLLREAAYLGLGPSIGVKGGLRPPPDNLPGASSLRPG